LAPNQNLEELWEMHDWLRVFNYFSRYTTEAEEVDEYWFIYAPNLFAARAELRKALRRYLTKNPDFVDVMVNEWGIDLDQYKKCLLNNIKPLTYENLMKRSTSSPTLKEDVLFDFEYLSDPHYVTPRVFVAELVG